MLGHHIFRNAGNCLILLNTTSSIRCVSTENVATYLRPKKRYLSRWIRVRCPALLARTLNNLSHREIFCNWHLIFAKLKVCEYTFFANSRNILDAKLKGFTVTFFFFFFFFFFPHFIKHTGNKHCNTSLTLQTHKHIHFLTGKLLNLF